MSSEKTTNLQLHKWVGTDYVKRTEFNENFETLDTEVDKNSDDIATVNKALSEHQANFVTHQSDFAKLRINFMDTAIELETMKAAELTGVDANIFIETFQNLDDVVLERGGYDNTNKRLEV